MIASRAVESSGRAFRFNQCSALLALVVSWPDFPKVRPLVVTTTRTIENSGCRIIGKVRLTLFALIVFHCQALNL